MSRPGVEKIRHAYCKVSLGTPWGCKLNPVILILGPFGCFWAQLWPFVDPLGVPFGPILALRNPLWGDRCPRTRSGAELEGPWGRALGPKRGPRGSFEATLPRFFAATPSNTRCSRGFWRKVGTLLHVFCCFFFAFSCLPECGNQRKPAGTSPDSDQTGASFYL